METGKDDDYAKCGVGRAVLDLPVVGIGWEDARAYCEWLSVETGERYALPTEAQWEYACRAGSTTRWCCGDDAAGLGDDAWFSDNAGGRLHRVGEKRPNAWGLYDMHGNCWEWCVDWYAADDDRHCVGSAVRTIHRGVIGTAGPHSGPYGDPGQIASGAQRRSQSTTGTVASGTAVAASGAAVAARSGEQPVPTNPSGPELGSNRVIRGGAWHLQAGICRSAFRFKRHPSDRISDLGFRLSRTV